MYITEDYARAIQKEQVILIKAMMKARNEHKLSEAQVKRLIFDSENVP